MENASFLRVECLKDKAAALTKSSFNKHIAKKEESTVTTISSFEESYMKTTPAIRCRILMGNDMN